MNSLRHALLLSALLALLAPRTLRADPIASAVRSPGGDVLLSVTPPDGAHLSASIFSVSVPGDPRPLPLVLPVPDLPGPFPAWSRPFSLSIPVPPGADSILLRCQLCTDESCLLPQTLSIPVAPAPGAAPLPPPSNTPPAAPAPPAPAVAALDGFASPAELRAFLAPALHPSPAESSAPESLDRLITRSLNPALRRSLPLTLLLILLGGLLLNATPCVLPLIPVNLLVIGAAGSLPRPRRALHGAAYALGITLAYGALGLLAARTGAVFGALSASPWPRIAMALLLLLFALAMLDVLHIDLARFRPRSASPRPAAPGLLPAFLLGAFSAVLAGSCIAPVLLAVLALTASLAAAGDPLAPVLPFTLGLGMALPWPLLAVGLPFPRPGLWMDRIRRLFAVLLLLAAAAFAFSAVRAFRHAPADSPFPVIDLSDPASPDALQSAIAPSLADGRPVLLSFSASWCASCHRMDASTFRDPSVAPLLDALTPIRLRADDPSAPSAAPVLDAYAVPGFPALRLLLPDAPPR